ncbi:MAG: zf-HC2 domain-containing protein [Pseudomonadales bacterium]|nr:zf-HC2 domain-containing protein [Pseudomonadales bacterium]
MLSCEEATRLMSDARERPLKVSERLVLGVHVSICTGCRRFGSQMDVLHKAMQNFAGGKNESTEDDK